MFCTSLKSVVVLEGESEIDGESGVGANVSGPVGKMKSSASHDGLQQMTVTSRVKNFRNFIASSSPLRKRRVLSQSSDSGLNTLGCGVFGVPLVDLVTSEGNDIPKLVRRVVEHVEQHGLREEGIYRINGSARTIENLKAVFNSIGDADFTNVDIASIAGILKLFLRELPTAIIPPDIESQLVDIQQRYPGDVSPEVIPLLRDCLSQLPSVNLAVFEYLIVHLSKVARHSDDNKMTPVSLSIVFGPGIFHCGGGLEGMRKQGYANSVLCRFIICSNTLFHPLAATGRAKERPAKPEPYNEHIRKKRSSPRSRPGEYSGGGERSSPRSPPGEYSGGGQRSSPRSPLGAGEYSGGGERSSPRSPPGEYSGGGQRSSPRSPLGAGEYSGGGERSSPKSPLGEYSGGGQRSFSERSVDEAIDQSNESLDNTSSPPRLQVSPPSSPLSPPPPPTSSSDEVFLRRQPVKKGKRSARMRSWSADYSEFPTKLSTTSDDRLSTTIREGDGGQSLSPYSSHTSSLSPPTSPSPSSSSPSLTPRSSKVINAVIEGSVKKYLFGPPSPRQLLPPETGSTKSASNKVSTDVYGLLLPEKCNSPATKKKKPHPPNPRDDHMTTGDITTMTSDLGATGGSETAVVQLRHHNRLSPGKVSVSLREGEGTEGEREGGREGGRRKGGRRERGRREEGRRNRRSVVVGGDESAGGTEVQVLSLSPESKGEGSEVMVVESGRVSDLVHQFEDIDGPPLLERPPSRHEMRAEEHTDVLQHLTKSRPKGPANRRLPSKKPSRHKVVDVESEGGREGERGEMVGEREGGRGEREGKRGERRDRERREGERGEGERREGERREGERREGERREGERRKGERTRDHLLTVSDGRQLKKSPRHERRKKKVETDSYKSRHRSGHHLSEVAPENIASTAAVEGWAEEERLGKTDTSSVTHTSRPPSSEPTLPDTPRTDNSRTKPKKTPLDTNRQKTHSDTHSGTGKPQTQDHETDRGTRVCEKAQEDVHVDSGAKMPPQSAEWEGQRSSRQGEKKGEERGGVVGGVQSAATPGLKETLDKLMSSLAKKRSGSGRPDSLQDMTPAQLSDEKNSVQRTLLHFEKIHGRPSSSADKELMRPLYERYREVKKMISAQHKTHTTTATHRQQESSSTKQSTAENAVPDGEQTLPSITLLSSGLAHSLPLDSYQPSSSSSHSTLDTTRSASFTSSSSPSISTAASIDRVTIRQRVRPAAGGEGEREKTLSELYGLQAAALAEKKKLRKILREFENQFMTTNGRAATKDDRLPKEREYQEYKAIKERLLYLANEINKNTQLQKTL